MESVVSSTDAARTRRMLTALKGAKLQEAMAKKPQSLLALATLEDLCIRVVTRHVKELHELGMVHVAGWERDARGYPTIRQYSWGKGEDVPCPTRAPAERMRARRAAERSAP